MKSQWLSSQLCLLLIFSTACEKKGPLTNEINETETSVDHIPDTTGYEISLHNNPKGTSYTIRDPEGKILGEEITAEELKKRFPKIHHEVRDLGSVNVFEHREHLPKSPTYNRRMEESSYREIPPPILEEALIDLPPLPDLRSDEQKARRRDQKRKPPQ